MSMQASLTRRSSGNSAVDASLYQAREKGVHEQQRVTSVAIEHRKHLPKDLNPASITDELRADFKKNGIELSNNATVEAVRTDNGRIKRRHWTVIDEDNPLVGKSYAVREWNKREKYFDDEGKEKRRIVDKGLDVFSDVTHDHSHKDDLMKDAKGNEVKWIETRELISDDEWVKNRVKLWNEIEKTPRRDAQTSFKFMLALPREFTAEQSRKAVRAWIKPFVDAGAVADIAFHCIDSGDIGSVTEEDKQRLPFAGQNPHAHIMITSRALERDEKTGEYQFADVKNPLLDDWQKYMKQDERGEWVLASGENLTLLRKSWADTLNEHLDSAGFGHIKVDHRTLEAQRKDAIERGDLEAAGSLDRLAEIHLGEKASNAEKNGYQTPRGDRNSEIKYQNQKKQERLAREKLKQEQKPARRTPAVAPSLHKSSKRGWLGRITEKFRKSESKPKASRGDKSKFVVKRKRMKWAHKFSAVRRAVQSVKTQSPKQSATEHSQKSNWSSIRKTLQNLRNVSHRENLDQQRTKEQERGISR